mgnify:FL=1
MSLLSAPEQQRILDAIRAAELQTSGEVRVHIENRCPDKEPMARATTLFGKLGMTQTQQRNGVLIYVALKSRRFCILGDSGIHSVAGQDFWQSARDAMQPLFAAGKPAEAIAEGVRRVGELLHERFPYQEDDVNELPDEISWGEN